MRFEFATATRIVFGNGVSAELPAITSELGRRALVVTGARGERFASLIERLRAAGVHISSFAVVGEPSTTMALDGLQAAREAGVDVVVAIGGGSVIDTGKAIAALLTNGGEPLDYLEVIGRGRKLTQASAPFIAVPTTAGTGSEVTKNAVLASPEYRVKVSLRSSLMLPRVALVDPELTYALPPSVTASTGLDALTQVLEPYVSKAANPLTDAICREGMQRAGRSLRRAYEKYDDPSAREDMALTSLFGGLALANAKLGAVHGIAGPLGGMFDAPHGALCARLLSLVMEANIAALRAREPKSHVLGRYEEVARFLTGKSSAHAEDGVEWVQEVTSVLNIPSLGSYGVSSKGVELLVEKSAAASSMKGNPIALTNEELHSLISRAAGDT